MRKVLFLTLFFPFYFTGYSQDKPKRLYLGLEHAKQELKQALTATKEKHVLVEKVISDKETAVRVAEPILFKIYGKDNIIKQRPYENHLIDGYYVIKGTLPEGRRGGTFLIIIHSKDAKVIKLTHGK